MTRKYGIIGWPLGHSMSPTLHNWGFGELGIDATYEAWPLRPEDLPSFMERVRSEPISGMSVTIPHKLRVMDHLDHITERALTVGAVNTLYWDGDRLCGENTDVIGMTAPLKKSDSLPECAMVLGAGGAARAAVAGLQELGVERILVCNRTREKADALAADLNVEAVGWACRMDEAPGLICNTTPLGMSGELEDLTPWDGSQFPERCIAYDIVYNPLDTTFLREARKAGCETISGLEMFLHQGLAQFRLWTGQDMDEEGARALLKSSLKG
ncbi:shikimate dehydrogenase [uncultured Pseudodesulfovibrio sp.]|uniref:shikimate dehydrogenase n=1 Tax=uncultured Pseudodesulfovibrio sp. TaxID=2035858 RepID=UPI0029C8067F|nr:shikimate dehydrogenase [uncultured Pseudodesulfovibrio sp.]